MVDESEAPLPKIHVVTTVKIKDYGITAELESSRAVGWFETLERATRCVTENWGDIEETIYNYAVIESVGPGLYPAAEETWFRWNGTAYEPCEKPEALKQLIGFALG